MRCTLDSNVLVYAADVTEGGRHTAALDLVRRAIGADCVLTLQGLSEFVHVARRKAKATGSEIEALVGEWSKVFPVVQADLPCLYAALDVVREHNLSFWDAMLWATAKRAGCRLIVTEDFQDGRALDGVTFANPFNPDNARLLNLALPPSA